MAAFINRRKFLQGCSLAIASLAGARLSNVAFASQSSDPGILIVVFLRGGWDSLNVAAPISGEDRIYYEKARPGIQIPRGELLPLDDRLGLHPALGPLHELYQDGKAAMIHAVGMNVDTRSHFDAMELIELGTPGSKTTSTGWITRHLQSAPYTLPGKIPLIASPQQPVSLKNNSAAVSMNQPGDLNQWDNGYLSGQQAVLQKLYQGETLLHQSGLRTLDVVQSVAALSGEGYTPSAGAAYQDDELGNRLKSIAQMIKMEVGMKVATVDFGGWDTHENQNDGASGYLGTMLSSLGSGLANFYRDLEADYAQYLNVIVLSEFGRRLAQNDSQGTDHGHGSLMIAMGGGLNGGKVYGDWPGLAHEQLYDHADLAVTTDFRQVLGELVVKRLKNPNLETVFPGFTMPDSLELYRLDE